MWFAILWAAAILFHLAANGDHLVALDRIGLAQLAVAGAAVVMVVRPSAGAAGVLAVLYLAVFWLKSPVVGNHEVILGLVSLVILIAAVRFPSTWASTVAPAARWILIVAYGFIAFSKLNSGFFDPSGSCAVVFAEALGAGFGIGRPMPAPFDHAVILGTVAVESAIPLLLMRRRTRRYGVLLALAFHFVLALDPVGHVWDFSATLLPLFLLFMPGGFHELADGAVQRIRGSIRGRPAVLALGLLLAVQWLAMSGSTPLPTWAVAYPIWLLVAGATGLAAVRFPADRGAAVGTPGDGGNAGDGWSMPRSFVPAVVLAVAIGVGPYLDYRSAAAFNMYANLQTVDGRSNHFVAGLARAVSGTDEPRAAVSPEDQTPSMAKIVSAAERSPLRYYAERDLLVPTENLDRYLETNPTEDPVVRWGAEVAGARQLGLGQVDRSDDLWHDVASGLRHKFGFRRAVDPRSPAGCLRAWGPIG